MEQVISQVLSLLDSLGLSFTGEADPAYQRPDEPAWQVEEPA